MMCLILFFKSKVVCSFLDTFVVFSSVVAKEGPDSFLQFCGSI